MGLAPGTQLGPHHIVGLLGAGGMGEVYRAQDTKLNRQVAIKILPREYAADPDRIARFQREAQAIAALNHPAIAAIYDFAQAEGVRFLVLELVEGETLADRLRHGPIPPAEALTIAKGICDALEAAHERGICHRDLKPANIKVTSDGRVKVLDFGLAKVLHDSSISGNVTNSPTLSLAGTLPGVILGTAGYMSPEQAKGFSADHRSDIFSLGCILYELLTGRGAFEGDTASEILASVLKIDPDYGRLPAGLNPRVIDLLRRCLEKQPKQRWHAVADVRVELEAILAEGVFASAKESAPRPWWRRAAVPVATALIGAAVAGVAMRSLTQVTPAAIAKFAIALPERQILPITVNRVVLGISPRGTELAYVSENAIFIRELGQLEAHRVSGTERSNPSTLVFSPDGQSIAYVSATDRAFKRISVRGGAPITICPVDQPPPYGASWSADGLLFAQAGRGILRVSPSGGTPEVVIASERDETFGSPQLLPGDSGILFSVAKGTAPNRWDVGQIVVQRTGGARKVVLEGGADARYVPTGHLVFAVGGTVLAVPFDLDRLEVRGSPVPIVEGVRRAMYVSAAAPTTQYAFSNSGSLVYVPGPLNIANTQSDLGLISRDGKAVPLKVPPGTYEGPRVAPNGRSIAVASDDGREGIVWVYDLNGGSSIRRLTFGGRNRYPIWSADSEWVAFQSDREGDAAVFRQRADGRGQPERLTKAASGTEHIPYAWTPDGKTVLVGVARDSRFSLWTLSLSNRTFAQWANVEARIPLQPTLSPDGQWVAYQSDESGSTQIFVQPFPDGGAKYMVPPDFDNHHPAWTPDGKALTYVPRQGVSYVVTVTTTPQVAFGTPGEILRGGRTEGPASAHRNHDHVPGTQQTLGVLGAGFSQSGTSASELQVVLNWFEELKQRASVR